MLATEQLFVKALNKCYSLFFLKNEPSSTVADATEIFCELALNPTTLLELVSKHRLAVNAAFIELQEYIARVDDWKIEGCPFGLKDQASILGFFLQLNNHPRAMQFFGNFRTSQEIIQSLKEWKDIDL